MTQCTLIFPVWVQAGWVQWHGTPQREKLFTTERRRCAGEVDRVLHVDGIAFHLCLEHATEMNAKKLFHWGPRPADEGGGG